MGTPRNFTAAVHQEEDWYVAQCLEVDDSQQYVTATPLVTSFQVFGAA
jgi:hypothetical protein